MYHVEKKEGYILLDREKKTEKYFSNWRLLVEYVGGFTKTYKFNEHLIENTILSNLNVTGKDEGDYVDRVYAPNNGSFSPYIYNHYTALKRYMIIKETGEGIVVHQLSKDVFEYAIKKLKHDKEEDERFQKWCNENKDKLSSYRLNYYSYSNRKRKYLKHKDSSFRCEPVAWTGRCYHWCVERSPKLRNKMLSNIDIETGKTLKSKYKVENLDLWDGRSRYHDRSWKSSTKCHKQWEKHLNKHMDYTGMRLHEYLFNEIIE